MKIGLTGAHGTGKSTMVKKILELLPDHKQYQNNQRLLATLPGFGVSSKAGDMEQSIITGTIAIQLMREPNIVCDRSLHDTFAYSKLAENVSNEMSQRLEETFSPLIKEYDVVFYLPIEFDVIDDNFRELDEEFRRNVDKEIQKYIKKYPAEYVTITGTIEQRTEQIKRTIKRLKGKQ